MSPRSFAHDFSGSRALPAAARRWNAHFLHFEQECPRQVLGAPNQTAKNSTREPAAKVWKDLFGQDQGQLEAAFLQWLQRQ